MSAPWQARVTLAFIPVNVGATLNGRNNAKPPIAIKTRQANLQPDTGTHPGGSFTEEVITPSE